MCRVWTVAELSTVLTMRIRGDNSAGSHFYDYIAILDCIYAYKLPFKLWSNITRQSQGDWLCLQGDLTLVTFGGSQSNTNQDGRLYCPRNIY